MRELTLNELNFVSGAKGSKGSTGSSGNTFLDMIDGVGRFGTGYMIGTVIYDNSETVRNISGRMIEAFDKVITDIRNDPRPDISRREAIDRMRNMKWGNPDGSEYGENDKSGSNYN